MRWWVGTVRFCVQKGWLIIISKMTLSVFSTHSTPPRLRTGDSMDLVCFWPSPTSMARRERQRRASGVNAVVGRNGPVLCAEGVVDYYFQNDPVCILDSFDTTPSPHRRFNGPSLLLAFAHIHGEAGAPTEGIRSECGGGSERSGFVCRRGGGLLFPK
jgi:hypothetical protein